MLPVETVLQQLGAQGYRDFTGFELDDGKYEVEGRDAEGRGVEIDVDAKTGEILKVESDCPPTRFPPPGPAREGRTGTAGHARSHKIGRTTGRESVGPYG